MIYLDYNATTPVLPKVLEAMMPYLTSEWGNPSSSYKFGSKLKGVVEVAREQVEELIGAHGGEVIFTSCATESNNRAIHAALKPSGEGSRETTLGRVNARKGAVSGSEQHQPTGKRHVLTPAVEHSSVLNYLPALEVGTAGPAVRDSETSSARSASMPYHVTYLPADRDGLLKLADLEDAITDDTVVVSLLWARMLRRDRW